MVMQICIPIEGSPRIYVDGVYALNSFKTPLVDTRKIELEYRMSKDQVTAEINQHRWVTKVVKG